MTLDHISIYMYTLSKKKAKNKKEMVKKEQLLQMSQTDHNLTVADIFPSDRVLDIQIVIDQDDWDTIRHQARAAQTALSEQRKYSPTDRPYTYTQASFSIDGVVFPQVGIRKKDFLSSSRNSDRPSLKIKLNHINETGQIDGLTNKMSAWSANFWLIDYSMPLAPPHLDVLMPK